MYMSPSGQRTNSIKKQNKGYQAPAPPSAGSLEEEALLLVIDTGIRQLNEPLTSVLNLSELLLTQAGPASPLAEDLRHLQEESQRIKEIVRGLQLLTEYKTIFLKQSSLNKDS
jgi:hypothetical protein